MSNEIPPHTKKAIGLYVEHHIPPGSFTRAVLENNLLLAVAHADPENLAALKDVCLYVHWEIPGNCHGSPGKVKEWLAQYQEIDCDDLGGGEQPRTEAQAIGAYG